MALSSSKTAAFGLFAALTNPGLAQLSLTEAHGYVHAQANYCWAGGGNCIADWDYLDFFLPTRGETASIMFHDPYNGTGGDAWSFTSSAFGDGCDAIIDFIHTNTAIATESGWSGGAETESNMLMEFDIEFRRTAWYTLTYTVGLETFSSAEGSFRLGGGLVASWSETTSDSDLLSGAVPRSENPMTGTFSLLANANTSQAGVGTNSADISGTSKLTLVECIADWDHDHDIDSDDYFDYLDDYANEVPDADLDGDDDWDTDDYFAFLDAYNDGADGCDCP